MNAQPNPSPSPNRDLLTLFREEYVAAMDDARVSAQHTQTEGWRRLYAGHKAANREKRRDMGKRLKVCATALEDFGLTEDGEKAVKDITKESAELRGSDAVFQERTVDRVCAPVLVCARIIEDYKARAARAESESPLHNVGLEELMRYEVAKQPRPKFNDETGVIEIADPTGEI